MITLVYHVKNAQAADEERAWLKELKVYPSIREQWNSSYTEKVFWIGMIVSADVAMLIKLRHPLQLQKNYNGK